MLRLLILPLTIPIQLAVNIACSPLRKGQSSISCTIENLMGRVNESAAAVISTTSERQRLTSAPEYVTLVPPTQTGASIAQETGASAPPTVGALSTSNVVPLATAGAQSSNGPATKKRKVAVPAIVTNTISDKYVFCFLSMFS
jgi:hypothetical protein